MESKKEKKKEKKKKPSEAVGFEPGPIWWLPVTLTTRLGYWKLSTIINDQFIELFNHIHSKSFKVNQFNVIINDFFFD